MATVGDLKVERLLERIAAMERRHAEEILNLEVEYVLKISAMMEPEETEEENDEEEAEDAEHEEDVQGSDGGADDGEGGGGSD